jgi:hypothetical protein
MTRLKRPDQCGKEAKIGSGFKVLKNSST